MLVPVWEQAVCLQSTETAASTVSIPKDPWNPLKCIFGIRGMRSQTGKKRQRTLFCTRCHCETGFIRLQIWLGGLKQGSLRSPAQGSEWAFGRNTAKPKGPRRKVAKVRDQPEMRSTLSVDICWDVASLVCDSFNTYFCMKEGNASNADSFERFFFFPWVVSVDVKVCLWGVSVFSPSWWAFLRQDREAFRRAHSSSLAPNFCSSSHTCSSLMSSSPSRVTSPGLISCKTQLTTEGFSNWVCFRACWL